MSELRQDPLTGRWVIMAAERAERPHDVVSGTARPDTAQAHPHNDPFLEGHEDQTPPEILACRDPGTAPNTSGWRVRVVPNKFPALRSQGSLTARPDGLCESRDGVGAHEVVIECPQFETNMSRLPVETIREVLEVYRARLVDLQRDPRLVYPCIFKNQGAAAGASLAHSHSQIIVTPLVPPGVQAELSHARRFHQQAGRCIVCQMLEDEIQSKNRVVLETANFVLFCPFASRFPFESWIVPRRHSSHFETISLADLAELANVLRVALRRMEFALDDPAFNSVFHTAPFGQQELAYDHWRIEILPRITGIAGFELGTGMFINPMLPEKAAEILREIGEGS